MDPRNWRPGSLVALFAATVGVILGSVPGWSAVEAVWLLASGFVVRATLVATLVGGLPLSIAWDGAGWPAAGMLYDRTREIDKPWTQRSVAWRSSAIGADFGDCRTVRHLVGPWYRWSDACADS